MEYWFNLNFDNASVQKAATVIYSILQKFKPDANSKDIKLCFLILHFNISQFNQFRLRRMAARFDRNFRFAFVKLNPMNYFLPLESTSSPITAEAYLRIMGPDFLPDGTERILYLDIDTLVVADISEIFELNFGNSIIAACSGGDPGLERKRLIGLPENAPYFNSGVMVINVPAWKKDDIGKKTLGFIKRHGNPLPRWDQDALNNTLHGKWTPLSSIYNTKLCGNTDLQPEMFEYLDSWLNSENSEIRKDIINQVIGGKIIHYTGWGQWKPWYKNSLAGNAAFYQNIYNNLPFFPHKARDYPSS